jgi:C-terminal processing protease CtpA/Prc
MRQHRLTSLLLLFTLLSPLTFAEQNAITVKPSQDANALTERGRENLTAFANLYGYVRFFYPGDKATKVDWDEFAIRAINEVEPSKTPAELANALIAIFAPVAPDVRLYLTGSQPPKSSVPVASKEVVVWKHLGLGVVKNPSFFSPYSSQRAIESRKEANFLLSPYRADLGGGVSCSVPLALPKNDTEQRIVPAASTATISSAAEDRAMRLADVIITWNIYKYFYPYFDTAHVDWPAALSNALSEAASDNNDAEFAITLRRLVAASRDGHGSVFKTAGSQLLVPPVLWSWIDGQIIAVESNGKVDVRPGDRLISIDGKAASEALLAEEALWSAATEQWIRYRALNHLLARSSGTAIQVEIEPFAQPGTRKSLSLSCTEPSYIFTEPRPGKISELEPGIYYVDLTRINEDDFAKNIEDLKRADAIIFDMRGYPRNLKNPIAILGHLTQTTMVSAQFLVPEIVSPDPKSVVLHGGGDWHISPASPYFKAKRLFLVDGRVISYAESIMGIVEYYKLGEILGSPTAGTNGDVDQYVLPGDYKLTWTGMKVLKQDGATHHGVGIQPTVPVSPTRAGIAAGKDEVLERALREARQRAE